MTTITHQTGRIAPALDTAQARLAAARTGFSAWRARRAVYLQTRHELSMLTDRDLADLGIARCDIPRIARSSARGG